MRDLAVSSAPCARTEFADGEIESDWTNTTFRPQTIAP